jgi:hypothetical protein
MKIDDVYTELRNAEELKTMLSQARYAGNFKPDNKYTFDGYDVINLFNFVNFAVDFIKGTTISGE